MKAILSVFQSKTKLAAVAVIVVAFLQLAGISVPPEVYRLLEGAAIFGGRDAIGRLIDVLKGGA